LYPVVFDYCNALLYCITDRQPFLASAVDPECGSSTADGHEATRPHLTSFVAFALLPVKKRVDFKLALLVFKSLRGETPSYLADDCQLIADSRRRRLRSADANALTVPRTNTRLGDRSFSVADRNYGSRDKLPVLDHFHFRHAPFYYLKVDWKEIKLVMVDLKKK